MWISDNLLAAAFHRYCLASKAWHRQASNTPGPLEARRRTGRRQLGYSGGQQFLPSPAPWAFSEPLNFSQWDWQPPQSLVNLKRQLRESQTALEVIPGWLRGWGLAGVLDRGAGSHELPAPAIDVSPVTPSFRADLDNFLRLAPSTPIEFLVSDTEIICQKLRQTIFLGEIQPHELDQISFEIWDALGPRLDETPHGHHLRFSICSAIVDGISSSKVFPPGLLKESFWNNLLVRMSPHPVDEQLCGLFGQAMRATRHLQRDGTAEGVVSVLDKFFSAWHSSEFLADTGKAFEGPERASSLLSGSTDRGEQALAYGIVPATTKSHTGTLLGNINSTTVDRQISAISAGLTDIGSARFSALFDMANQLVLGWMRVPSPGRSRLRYNWLSVLARTPFVTKESLFRTAKLLSSSFLQMEPLGGSELCSLMLSQWESRGETESADALRQWHRGLNSGNEAAAVASLALAIWQSNSRNIRLLHGSLWHLLDSLGRSDDMIESLVALSHLCRVPRGLLGALSAVQRDHRKVLRLAELYKHELRGPGGSDWIPALFKKHAAKIVLDPSLPNKTIWEVLDILRLNVWVDNLEPTLARHRGSYGQQRAEIVRDLAVVFSEAQTPHLSERQAFRQVTQCVRFLEEVTGEVPAPAMAALRKVVTRDLARGEPGRTSRLKWFIDVVERNNGSQAAFDCREELREWRRRLRRHQRALLRSELAGEGCAGRIEVETETRRACP